MQCLLCKTGSLSPVNSGETQICQCSFCEAAWFDSGGIRELTEGRFPENIEPLKEDDLPARWKEKNFARMSRAWGKAAFLFCPRCSRQMAAVDFQNTGTPVFHCRGCGGILVSRDEVVELAGKFGFLRKNAAMYQNLGESMISATQKQLNLKYAPLTGESGSLDPKKVASFVPIVIPLRNEIEKPELYPIVSFMFLALMVAAYLFGFFGIAGVDEYQAQIALPSGTGAVSASMPVLLPALFFHGGVVSLLVNCLFLYVLGDNIEDRMGHVLFFFFYLACGAVAGILHIILGKAGASAALGASGAVAGVLGAYIVFFPQEPITVYRAGEVSSMPAYFLACAWVIMQFFLGWMPLPEVFNPAPYSIAGNLGGFAAGAGAAALWMSIES